MRHIERPYLYVSVFCCTIHKFLQLGSWVIDGVIFGIKIILKDNSI